jgi:hypothetical protein
MTYVLLNRCTLLSMFVGNPKSSGLSISLSRFKAEKKSAGFLLYGA